MHTTVLVEGPDVVVEAPGTTLVGTSSEALVEQARRAHRGGTDRIELCGGLGPVPHAEVRAAVPGVPVGAVMYGFESLEAVAAFKRRYADGHAVRDAFLFHCPGADPVDDRRDEGPTAYVPVPDRAVLPDLAGRLRDEGVTLIEMYAGLGPEDAAAVLSVVAGEVAVGLALYPSA